MRDNTAASWKQNSKELENIFCKLPIRQGTGTGIPYENVIPGIARELMLMAPVSRPKVASAKAIRSLTKSIGHTITLLDKLSRSDSLSLNYQPADLRELKIKLRILHAAAKSRVSRRPNGQPLKVQPGKIASVVAQHYFRLTGEKPTVRTPVKGGKAYGPFLELLSDIYKILGVDASAESQARAVIKMEPRSGT